MLCAPIYYYMTFPAESLLSISNLLNSVGFQRCPSEIIKFSLESNRPNLIWIALLYTGAEFVLFFPYWPSLISFSFVVITTTVSGCLLISQFSTSVLQFEELTLHTCNHKSQQAHRGLFPPHDIKHDVTSLKLHHHYCLKNHLPCWFTYLLSHEQDLLKHLFKNSRCYQSLQDLCSLDFPAFQSCHAVEEGWRAMTVLGDLHVLLPKRWVCCSAGLTALRGQMNFHRQDCINLSLANQD